MFMGRHGCGVWACEGEGIFRGALESVMQIFGHMNRAGRWRWGFALVLLLTLRQAAGAAEAVLVCDDPVIDFGRLEQSAVVTNVFTVRNEGKVSFVLDRILTGCGCSEASLSSEVIDPGKEAKVTAVFSAAGRRGPQRISLWVIEATAQQGPVPPMLHPRSRPRPALILRLEGYVEP